MKDRELENAVNTVRRHLFQKKVSESVSDLGMAIARRLQWDVRDSSGACMLPRGARRPTWLDGACKMARAVSVELCRIQQEQLILRGAALPPFSSPNPSILDTSGYFGREEVNLAGCKSEAIDERNLTRCRKLWVEKSSVLHLNTQHLQNLTYFSIVETKITQLDTIPLVNLRELWMYKTEISSLDTSSLGKLQILQASETKLTSLDTRPLTSLGEINVGSTRISALNTAPLNKLEKLQIHNTQISSLDTAPLVNLTILSIEGARITQLDTIPLKKLEALSI